MLLMSTYFLVISSFYIYTVFTSKKYIRNISWCENVLKQKRSYLVTTPLIISGMLSYLILNKHVPHYFLYLNLFFLITWIITIYKSKIYVHTFSGVLYILSLFLLCLYSILLILTYTKLQVITAGILVNLYIIFDILKKRKITTIHEELQFICFFLYHLSVVI